MKKGIIFSHGFGVRFDDRGLLTEIANAFPQYTAHLFDYNLSNEALNTLTVQPLTKQAKILESELESFVNNEAPESVSLICHSQGCIVAALADLKTDIIDKIIFLAPPTRLETKRLTRFFEGREGSAIDLEGVSRLARNDSSTTIVPAEYWQEFDDINIEDLYKNLAEKYDLAIVRASEDEVLGETDFSYLSGVEIIDLPANHNFNSQSRKQLLQILEELLP